MPLSIKDDHVAGLVRELAERRGVTKQEAVKMAVEAALKSDADQIPLRERLRRLRAAHPLPPHTGLQADKAFYDALSGEN